MIKIQDYLSSCQSEHRYIVFYIVDGLKRAIHSCSNRIEAIQFAEKFSDSFDNLFIEENMSASIVYNLTEICHD